jgi:hypothetical protein
MVDFFVSFFVSYGLDLQKQSISQVHWDNIFLSSHHLKEGKENG